MKPYVQLFESKYEALLIQITGKKDGEIRGTMTPDQFKQYLNVPKSSTRFLADIVSDFNKKSDEAVAEIIVDKRR